MDNDEILSLAWNTHQTVLMSDFESLLQSETLVDCTLAAQGQYIKAHKIIISACSPFLKTLLTEHTDNHPIIILNETTFDDLKSMLEYMYRGEVSLKKKDLVRFIRSAEALQIRGLVSNSVLGNRVISDDSEGPPTRKKRMSANPEEIRPLASNDDLSQSGSKDTDDNVLLVPKIENTCDEVQNEFEEMELTEAQIETSEPVEQIIEDEPIQNWEQGANESNGLQETQYNDISEDKLVDLSDSNDKYTVIVLADCCSVLREDENCEKEESLVQNSSNYKSVNETILEQESSTSCPICCTKFDDNNTLQRHMKRRHPKDQSVHHDSESHPFQCQKCGNIFKLSSVLKAHEKWECGKEPKFQCNICEKKFHIQRYLRQHMTKHATRIAKGQDSSINLCQTCGKCFKHPSNLENHQKYECGVEPKFECEICKIKFHFKAQRNEHLLSFHTDASVQTPSVPAAELSFDEDLKYRCELCPRAFTRVGSLNYHVSRKHSGKAHQTERDPDVYPFVCAVCGNRYKNSTQLCRHRRWECGKEPMFQCTQCAKKFHHRHGLKQHIRLHLAQNAKQKPTMDYYCDKCGKGYKLRSSLNNHTKWECGKEPIFACTICFVKFSHKGNLKKHILAKHIH